MDTESIGGSELTMPVQATVIMLSRSKPGSVPRQESITAGTGASSVVGPMARKALGKGKTSLDTNPRLSCADQREAKTGQGTMSLAGFGAAPQAGLGGSPKMSKECSFRAGCAAAYD